MINICCTTLTKYPPIYSLIINSKPLTFIIHWLWTIRDILQMVRWELRKRPSVQQFLLKFIPKKLFLIRKDKISSSKISFIKTYLFSYKTHQQNNNKGKCDTMTGHKYEVFNITDTSKERICCGEFKLAM